MPPAVTGNDISLFVGGAPFAAFVMVFVSFMMFANSNSEAVVESITLLTNGFRYIV